MDPAVTLLLIILLFAILAGIATSMRGCWSSRLRHKTSISRKSFRRAAHVYLLRSKDDPSIYKIGFTKRSVVKRMAEISARHRVSVEVIYTVEMPHADIVEGRIHQRLSRAAWRVPFSRGLGCEWYRPPHGAVQMVEIIWQVAQEVEAEARKKNAWGDNQAIRINRRRISA